MKWVLATASIAIFAIASSAQAVSSASVVIRHQVRGCHAWSVNGGAYKPSQVLAVMRGTAVTFTNNDVMPHTLIKTRGGRLVIQHAKMGHMGAKAKVVFSHAGVYKLKTRAGEDYPNMDGMKTIGKDNDLRITVLVH